MKAETIDDATKHGYKENLCEFKRPLGLCVRCRPCGMDDPVPLHLQPAGRRLGYKEGDLPVAEKQAKRIITLPVHQHLTRDQVQFMVDSVTAFYRR